MKDIVSIKHFPIAVYCTLQKKCVLIFNGTESADKYVFNKLQYQSNRSRYLVTAKGKTDKNVFQTSLAFRFANEMQKKILGENEIVILDKRFLKKGYEKRTTESYYPANNVEQKVSCVSKN